MYQRNAVSVEAIQYSTDNLADVLALLTSNKVTFTIEGSVIQLPGMLAPQLASVDNWIVIQAGLPTVLTDEDFTSVYSKVQERIDTVELGGYTILLENVAYLRGDTVVLTKGVEMYLPAGSTAQFKEALNKWRDSKEQA